MDIDAIRAFFMWCTIMNGGLLILSFLLVVFAREWAFRMHSRWFTISRDSFNVMVDCFLGFYKILVIVFNLVPYIALVIIG